jgi:hypothetical protein
VQSKINYHIFSNFKAYGHATMAILYKIQSIFLISTSNLSKHADVACFIYFKRLNFLASISVI